MTFCLLAFVSQQIKGLGIKNKNKKFRSLQTNQKTFKVPLFHKFCRPYLWTHFWSAFPFVCFHSFSVFSMLVVLVLQGIPAGYRRSRGPREWKSRSEWATCLWKVCEGEFDGEWAPARAFYTGLFLNAHPLLIAAFPLWATQEASLVPFPAHTRPDSRRITEW